MFIFDFGDLGLGEEEEEEEEDDFEVDVNLCAVMTQYAEDRITRSRSILCWLSILSGDRMNWCEHDVNLVFCVCWKG